MLLLCFCFFIWPHAGSMLHMKDRCVGVCRYVSMERRFQLLLTLDGLKCLSAACLCIICATCITTQPCPLVFRFIRAFRLTSCLTNDCFYALSTYMCTTSIFGTDINFTSISVSLSLSIEKSRTVVAS